MQDASTTVFRVLSKFFRFFGQHERQLAEFERVDDEYDDADVHALVAAARLQALDEGSALAAATRCRDRAAVRELLRRRGPEAKPASPSRRRRSDSELEDFMCAVCHELLWKPVVRFVGAERRVAADVRGRRAHILRRTRRH